MSRLFQGNPLHADEYQKQRLRKSCIAGVVLGLHLLFLGIPVVWSLIDDFFRPPKVNAFRVKIGPKELSRAPLVGPPERTRPAPGKKAPLSEPEVKIPVPKPAPKPEPRITVPKRKTVKKKPVKRAKVQKKTTRPRKVQRNKPVQPRKSDGVYRPPKGSNEFTIGGRNYNPNVPIGTRNRGQEKGKENFTPPGGGLTEEMTKYNERAGLYLKNVWMQPPKSLLGNSLPAVTIEVEISPDGRVLARKILQLSGVPAMDESVQNLLKRLDRMPAPPKQTVVQFILQTDD